MLASGGGEFVCADTSVRGGDTPLCFYPSGFEHALQGGVERTLFDLQQLVRSLLDVLGQGITMQRFTFEGLEKSSSPGPREKDRVAPAASLGSILARHY
jgi:hypothetical protein